jgi:hypothetical protein
MNPIEEVDINLISYCGFFCGACPKLIKNECSGCKGDMPSCAAGYKKCKVRPCCIENAFSSCAKCIKYDSVKECKIYNPVLIRFGQFITRTSRRKGIEVIKEKGAESFLIFMKKNNLVTIKN